MNDNVITGNRALYAGGGIHLKFGGGYPMERRVIAGNEAQVGGGVFIESHPGVEIINCTIAVNSADVMGGGVYIATFSHSDLMNTVVWGNWAADYPAMFVMMTDTVVAEYCDIEGGYEGEGNIDADPLFADGGNLDFNLTWANYPAEDSTKSPCIDAGNPEQPYFDPDGTRNDMGAYYFEQMLSVNNPDELSHPENFRLFSPYPNPFNASTAISFKLQAASEINLSIYNISGQRVWDLEYRVWKAGTHEVVWNAEGMPSGVYLVRMTVDNQVPAAESRHHTITRRVVLVK